MWPQHNSSTSGRDGEGASWLSANGWGSDGWTDERSVTTTKSTEDNAAAAANSFGSLWGWDEQTVHSSEGVAHDEAMDDERSDAAARPAATTASVSPLTLVDTRRLPPQSKFKPLVRMNKSSSSAPSSSAAQLDCAASPNQPSISASSVAAPPPSSLPPLLRPVRFVKAKQLHQSDDDDAAIGAEALSGAAEGPVVVPQSAAGGSLLARGVTKRTTAQPPSNDAVAAASKPTAALKDAPSLLAVKKTGGASSSAHSSAASSSSSTSSLTCAHIFLCTYRLAERKKQQPRDGFLHLFKSALQSAPLPASTSAPADNVHGPSVDKDGSASNFLKARLYSERGVLLDEQIGRAVMQPEPPSPRQGRVSSFEGGLWDSCMDSQRGRKRKRYGDEADSEEDDDVATKPPATPAAAEASPPRNIFASDESVVLGGFACALEDEISQVEFEQKTKILTGQLSNAPLSRFASTNSCVILGPPIPSSNKGFALLSKFGGGMPSTSRPPVALTWRTNDASRYGIGFKDRTPVKQIQQHSREHGPSRGQQHWF